MAEKEKKKQGSWHGTWPPPKPADEFPLWNAINFNILARPLANDLQVALAAILESPVGFFSDHTPLNLFRRSVANSIRDIESDPRGLLFKRFLLYGPYPENTIAASVRDKWLDADEVAEAVTFVYSSIITRFQGDLTEMYAADACRKLRQELVARDILPQSADVIIGDSIRLPGESGHGRLKGPDLVFLSTRDLPNVQILAVVEVKSGRKSFAAMETQLARHVSRFAKGLYLWGRKIPKDDVRVGFGPDRRLLKITIQPSDWKLPRSFCFRKVGRARRLFVDEPDLSGIADRFIDRGSDRWHVSLKWSKEAIAESAYEMTAWYMEQVGKAVFSAEGSMPAGWAEMTPAQAGANAVKQSLYWAIRPYAIREKEGTLTKAERALMQRAIALYNCYCFGYSLGMNYRNAKGSREMLWPQDLDEIAAKGRTESGARIR
ncbi:MAG: hypothetical protein WC712_13880 [Candidatus Brocadiia bacterium]